MIQNIQQEYDGDEEDCFAQFIEQESKHGRDGDIGKYIVMQYTGLKDKNGKEIYEGDIVRNIYYITSFKDNFIKDDGTFRVLELNDSIMTVDKTRKIEELINVKIPEFYHQVNNLKNDLGDDLNKSLEIIGNLYENPELYQ